MPTTKPTTIPDESVWYVKTGLDRAIRSTKESIRSAYARAAKLESEINANPLSPENEFRREFLAETRFQIEYHEQWLSEALSAYRLLSPSLQPAALSEH